MQNMHKQITIMLWKLAQLFYNYEYELNQCKTYDMKIITILTDIISNIAI